MSTGTREQVSGAVRPGQPVIERASAGDRAFLAMDVGPVPQQFGVVLLLDDAAGLDLDRVRALLADRVRSVPRLRQRLVRPPFGCGGPIWVDDPGFDVGRHVHAVECRWPGDDDGLLETALSAVMRPLPRTAPLWSATLVTGLPAGRAALVVVLHHVLADGVGGLAVLAHLVDPGVPAANRSFPRPRPPTPALLRDAMGRKAAALRGAGQSWRRLRTSFEAGGGLHPPRVTDCSLLRRSGPRRRLAVVRADAGRLRETAHRHGATTNDALLVAVAGALHRLLLARGEHVDSFVLAVPVSGRRAADGAELGNMVAPVLVEVPATGEVGERLAAVAEQMRTRKESAVGPASIAVLGWAFRAAAKLHGYRWYMNHQHRLHTLVSHLRGPDERVTFDGLRVGSAVPTAVAEGGNATVSFEALSYAGTLTVGALVDPDHFPDVDVLTEALRTELDELGGASSGALTTRQDGL